MIQTNSSKKEWHEQKPRLYFSGMHVLRSPLSEGSLCLATWTRWLRPVRRHLHRPLGSDVAPRRGALRPVALPALGRGRGLSHRSRELVCREPGPNSFQANGAVTIESTTGIASFNFVTDPGPPSLPGGSSLQCGNTPLASGAPTPCEKNSGPVGFQLTIKLPRWSSNSPGQHPSLHLQGSGTPKLEIYCNGQLCSKTLGGRGYHLFFPYPCLKV
jgi:hypothetical protein